MIPSAAAPPPRPTHALRPTATMATRMALLALAGLLEGLLVANGPILERYAALRLGSRGLLIDLDLLFALGFAVAGSAAALAPWSHTFFTVLVTGAATWSLSESSLHPYWLVSKKTLWRPHDPSTGLLLAHVLVIALVCAAILLHALEVHRRAALAQGMAPELVPRQSRRLLQAGSVVLAATVAVAGGLAFVLDDVLQGAVGVITGPTAFAVLLGSAILLLGGVALLATSDKKQT